MATSGFAKVPEGEIIEGYGGARAWVSTPKHHEDIIYEFCRALKEAYPIYTQAIPGTAANTFEQAYSLSGLINLVPFHDGSVKFFKDQGVWTAEHEKFQQEALKNQAAILGDLINWLIDTLLSGFLIMGASIRG